MEGTAYFPIVTIIYSLPFITTILFFILFYLTFSKRHSGEKINICIQQTYNVLGYLFIILTHLLILPFLLILLQNFFCGTALYENFDNEHVRYPSHGNCWDAIQVIYAAVGSISAILYILIIISSLIFFSSSSYISPLHWADISIYTHLTVITEKIVMASFMIFDMQVFFFTINKNIVGEWSNSTYNDNSDFAIKFIFQI